MHDQANDRAHHDKSADHADHHPQAARRLAVVVGYREGSLDDAFDSCELSLVLDNGVDIPNEEQGLPVQVCRGPVAPWALLWPSFRHYD